MRQETITEVAGMRARIAVIVVALMALTALEAWATREPMDLLTALKQGKIQATFYGNGDESVRGRIRSNPYGPDQIYVPPGTQFWAQQPGRQGMTTLGYVPIDLSRQPMVYVEIPTACTNLDLVAPTGYDIMVPTACPDARMAALCNEIGRLGPRRQVAQLAVWAIANDPPWENVEDYAMSYCKGTEEQKAAEALRLRDRAALLLGYAGLDADEFAMFR